MKFILSLFLLASPLAQAADCTLDQAKRMLRNDLTIKAEDGKYDGKVDFCIFGSTPEERALQIDNVVSQLNANPAIEQFGGDYNVILCDADQGRADVHDIVWADVYCSGTIEYTRYTRD